MLTRLIASAPSSASGPRNHVPLVVSFVAHLGLLALLIWWGGPGLGASVSEPDEEEVTWIEVALLEEDLLETFEEEEAILPPDAPPPPPEPETAEPELADEGQGFQELREPDILDRIPEPDLQRPAVSAADFAGRGIAGGLAAGRVARSLPDPGAVPSAMRERVYVATEVDELPSIRNLHALAELMEALYPMALRQQGVSGQVLVRFVVTEAGEIEEGSLAVVDPSDREFAAATRELLRALRWNPARLDRTPVRVLVEMPVEWNVSR